jgi:cytochrome b involved in lipid metabolism
MRYLSIIFASLLLVGCAQTTDVESTESDMQSQPQTSESTEVDSTPETDQVEPEDSSEQTDEPEPAEQETESEGEETESEGEEAESESNESEATETESAESEPSETESTESESTEPEEEMTEEEPVEEEAPEETEPAGYTMAMVSENDDASSCWSVINGNVYDLTEWINSHPGGSSNILSLCGKDGSDSFNARHGGQSNPESTLQSYLLGPLS